MENEDAKAINDGFEQLIAESFAIKRMLGILFAASPAALERLDAIDEQALRDMLEPNPVTDAFIERALLTTELVRRIAHRGTGL